MARRFVIAGTGVLQPFANAYYRALAERADACVLALPHGGIGPVDESVARITEVVSAAGGPVELIGHSQGGLVAAMLARSCPVLVRRVVTIGAPLAGTLWCRVPVPVPGLHDMAVPHAICPADRITNIVGSHDTVVVPWQSGLVPGAVHHVVPAGHIALPNHPVVLDIVSAWANVRSPHGLSHAR